MKKSIIVILLVLLLAVPLFAQLASLQKLQEKMASHFRKFKAKAKGNLPPNVRKCLNVTCQPGFTCFYGRCVDKDDACATIKCGAGLRCVKGKCIPRKTNPLKMICPPLGFKLQKEQCDYKLRQQCKVKQVAKNVCGFNPQTREFHDYKSPCDACTDTTMHIKFFYSTTCDAAPRICDSDEECMNGVCTDIFKDSAFENKESCNSNKDCEPQEYCAGHHCIDKRDLYSYLESMSEVKDVLVRVA